MTTKLYKCVDYSPLDFALPFNLSLGFNLSAMLDRFARMPWCALNFEGKKGMPCFWFHFLRLVSTFSLVAILATKSFTEVECGFGVRACAVHGRSVPYFVSVKSAIDSPLSSSYSLVCARWPPSPKLSAEKLPFFCKLLIAWPTSSHPVWST